MELIQDSLQQFDKLKSSADFCLECGDLLNLPIFSDYLECPKCGFKVSLLGNNINIPLITLRLSFGGNCYRKGVHREETMA
jgi:hypothetical protein